MTDETAIRNGRDYEISQEFSRLESRGGIFVVSFSFVRKEGANEHSLWTEIGDDDASTIAPTPPAAKGNSAQKGAGGQSLSRF